MNIIAIGGGDVRIGATAPLDRELIALTGLTAPRVLFLPTATDDDEKYVESVEIGYGRLGCSVAVLRLYGEDGSPEIAARKIRDADAIYVGGGNTKSMIAKWRELGVDGMLREHLEAGKPAGGVSAGALCWFRVGNSDWPQYEGIPGVNTASLDCLGFVDLALCPHTLCEDFRLGEFRAMMREAGGVGVGVDDWCALQIRGNEYRVLSAQPGAIAHRIEWQGDNLLEREMPPHEDFRPLSDL